MLERFVFGYNKENSSPQLRQGSCHLFVQIEQEPQENSVLVNLDTFQPGEEPLEVPVNWLVLGHQSLEWQLVSKVVARNKSLGQKRVGLGGIRKSHVCFSPRKPCHGGGKLCLRRSCRRSCVLEPYHCPVSNTFNLLRRYGNQASIRIDFFDLNPWFM